MTKSAIDAIPVSPGFAIGRPIFYSSDIISLSKKASKPRILIAESLSPKEAELADLTRFQGLVLEKGGQASHTAIVARTCGIPAVVGVKTTDIDVTERSTIIVDGFSGRVISDPDKETLKKYKTMLLRYSYIQRQFLREKDELSVTLDGCRVEVGANASSLYDVEKAFSSGAEGIGVLRTELLFIGRNEPPTEEEQFQIYKAVAQRAKNASVIIRTLDIGGDKHPGYLEFAVENNPFLGLRGLRYYLSNPEIIETQVSAILRAAHTGNIKLMLPMVTKTEEINAFMAILRDVMSNLDRRGVRYNKNMHVGAMIEVPSAAEIVTELSCQMDFFSIGTNDLIQYLEAVDRTNERVVDLFDSYHPAVFRVISRVLDHAHHQNKWVGLCGEMAADPLAVSALVGLGIDELSMAPIYIPMIKYIIRNMRKAECVNCCQELLQAHDSNEVTHLLRMFGIRIFQFFYKDR